MGQVKSSYDGQSTSYHDKTTTVTLYYISNLARNHHKSIIRTTDPNALSTSEQLAILRRAG